MSNKRGGGRRCLKENSILNSHFVFLDDLPDLIGNIVLKMRVELALKPRFFSKGLASSKNITSLTEGP